MRKLAALAGSIGLLASGCTPITQELRNSGGYPGYLLDRHMFDASRSKQVHLLRAAIILAMASRMATATIRDGREADAFAEYLAAGATELNYAAADLYPGDTDKPCAIRPDPEAGKACANYYANFESDMPLVEARLIRVLLAALPESRARQFLADATKGNVLAAAWTAARGAYESASGLHRSAAVYRSGLEILASSPNLTCVSGQFDSQHDNIWTAVDCLGLAHDSIKHRPGTLQGDGLRVEVSRDAFHALMLIARTSCAKLPISNDETVAAQLDKRNKACAKVVFEPAARPDTVN